ncbi:MAG: 3-oxoacyl-ACP reductase FabG [Clostridia bacterium]|nr:MAG: 3-oxoacyl-ACP reductase FabG [Clostridia bacterium]
MLLQDKVAIITGAGQGIGRAYALGFAREGAKVAVVDIVGDKAEKVAAEIAAQGGESLAVRADVSDGESMKEMADAVAVKYGRIDILLNNAGLYYGIGFRPWTEITVADWDRVFAVNIKGMWLCSKAVAPLMMSQRQGKIINISSGTVMMGVPRMLHYVSSKGAVIAFTRALATELGEYNINVNCIAPGLTSSEATLTMPNARPGFVEQIAMQQCLKRPEQPDDLVGTALYLASDLSNFITGQTIVVDGGWARH